MTECDHYEVHYEHLRKRAEAAEARLAQIAELLDPYASDLAPSGYSRIVDALRIAHGEEQA